MRQFFIAPIKLLTWIIIKMVLAVQYILHPLKNKLSPVDSKNRYHPYHCVEIEPLDYEARKSTPIKICSCVLKQKGARYLSNNAPQLPLPQCDSKNCTCHYKHHNDRRGVTRRSCNEIHRQLYWHINFNHRAINDRRKRA